MNDSDLRDDLIFLREMGFTHLAVPVRTKALPNTPTLDENRSDPAWYEEERRIAPTIARLSDVASTCILCRLATTRTQVVFGTGNENADLMFIGEGPGRDEDLQGEPFVGRAGQLLTDIIKAMKLTREDVYITNVVKCRPPENRNPEPDEMDACRPYLQRQIEFIKPKVIVTLGRFALQSTMQRALSISSARGEWLTYGGRIKVMPTYHPAYLLRNPAAKKDVWTDMKKVMAELELG